MVAVVAVASWADFIAGKMKSANNVCQFNISIALPSFTRHKEIPHAYEQEQAGSEFPPHPP